jgi:hypothetical protein
MEKDHASHALGFGNQSGAKVEKIARIAICAMIGSSRQEKNRNKSR